MYLFLYFTLVFFTACQKDQPANHPPENVRLSATTKHVDPFVIEFTAMASDVDGDALQYAWDFGNGTQKQGTAIESATYEEGKDYEVIVKVSDGKSNPVEARIRISTKTSTFTINYTNKFQTMVGFGAFGTQNVPWSDGPFTSPAFINLLVNDLGATIVRDEVPTNFEYINDNDDPFVTDLLKFNITKDYSGTHRHLGTRLQFYKDVKTANPNVKFIASVWSPPAWMKTNNALTNGTNENSAPAYNPNPNSSSNQLRVDMYEEFAEMCVAYIQVLKRETGIDLYAFSIQNEPRFSQSYQSCLYNGTALRDLLKVVGKRFEKEGIQTLLFLPEDIGWLGGVESMIKPALDDPQARQYVGAVAVHGYDLDGIKPNSPSVNTWNTMYSWGAKYDLPIWMTETSGYKNDWNGAMDLAKAIYTALRHGNVSAWVFWTLSNNTLDEYSLINASLQKSKRYYISKNFYRFIHPGALRLEATSNNENVVGLAFWHPDSQKTTFVLLNVGTNDQFIRLKTNDLPEIFEMYRSSATEDCVAIGNLKKDELIRLPATSVTTFYSK